MVGGVVEVVVDAADPPWFMDVFWKIRWAEQGGKLNFGDGAITKKNTKALKKRPK